MVDDAPLIASENHKRDSLVLFQRIDSHPVTKGHHRFVNFGKTVQVLFADAWQEDFIHFRQ